jgi:hypothetical protein
MTFNAACMSRMLTVVNDTLRQMQTVDVAGEERPLAHLAGGAGEESTERAIADIVSSHESCALALLYSCGDDDDGAGGQ